MSDHIEQEFVSFFTMDCPMRGESVSGNVVIPEPDFLAAEDLSELNSEGQGEIECSNCDSHFSCHLFFAHGECTITLDDHPDANIWADTPHYWPPEDWSFGEPPSHPYDIFKETISEIREIAVAADEEQGSSILNRMCFAQLISALEAYLADTLINAIREKGQRLTALVKADSILRTKKYSLEKIAETDDFLWKVASERLRELLYHNIPRIDPLFKAVFERPVVVGTEDRVALLGLVSDRHDCVHRNGRTKEGDSPQKYTIQFVLEAINLTTSIVQSLEEDVNPLYQEYLLI